VRAARPVRRPRGGDVRRDRAPRGLGDARPGRPADDNVRGASADARPPVRAGRAAAEDPDPPERPGGARARPPRGVRPRLGGGRASGAPLGPGRPRPIPSAAHRPPLGAPPALAERLPKPLIPRTARGAPVPGLLAAFDRAWAAAAPHSVFGPRARWIEAVRLLSATHPVLTRPPYGGRGRWRLGEVTLPWEAVAPPGG